MRHSTNIVAEKPKLRISAEESARRRSVLSSADADQRIEGLFRTPESEPVYQAFVRGEIELEDILPRIQALHHYRL